MKLFHFVAFYDNHRTGWQFLHFPLYLVSGIAALEIGGKIETAITLHVNHTGKKILVNPS